MRALVLVLAGMYATAVLNRMVDPAVAAASPPTAIIPTLGFLAAGIAWSFRPLPPRYAHPAAFAAVVVIAAETIIRGSGISGTNLTWTLIGAGAILLRTRWLIACDGAVILAWAGASLLGVGDWRLNDLDYTLSIVTATALGGVIFVARRGDIQSALDAARSAEESRDGYRRLMAVLQDGVVRLDGEGRITRMNQRAQDILGSGEAEVAGRSFADAGWTYETKDGGPFDLSALAYRTVIATHAPAAGGVVGIRRADGRLTWVRQAAAAGRFDSGGRPDEIIVSLADVTALHDALLATSASEARVRELVDTAGDLIAIVGPNDTVDFANPAVGRVLGRPMSEILGAPVLALADPVDRERAAAELADGPGGPDGVMTMRALRGDGASVWLEIKSHRLGDGRLELIGRDVSARMALQAERDRLADALEQSSDAVLLADQANLVVYVNRAFEMMHRTSRDALIGRSAEAIGVLDEPTGILAERQAAMETAGRWSGDLVHQFADGERMVANSRLIVVRDASNQPVGSLLLESDVTWERGVAERLAGAARMEAVGQLAGGIAHDFNNLLTAILGHAELAAALVDHPDVGESLGEITKAGQRARTLTAQLLAFGRRALLRPERVSLEAVVAALEPMLRGFVGEDVRLVVELQPAPAVRVDRSLLEQSIVNLVGNARDAMAGQGTITITVGPGDEHTPGDERSWTMLRVTDTGTGIPPEVRARMFEPFFTTKAPGQGTGLGLAMVHAFADQAGGRVDVSTGPTIGTSMTVVLPAADAEATPLLSEVVTPDSRTAGATVLVVEDEQVLRAIARRVLSAMGYRVLVAASGEDAEAIAAEPGESIDLLFTDIVMPGMHGITLAERLRRARPGLRVLVTSGYTRDDVARRGITMPDRHFLPKPYTPSMLQAAIEDVFGHDLPAGD